MPTDARRALQPLAHAVEAVLVDPVELLEAVRQVRMELGPVLHVQKGDHGRDLAGDVLEKEEGAVGRVGEVRRKEDVAEEVADRRRGSDGPARRPS